MCSHTTFGHPPERTGVRQERGNKTLGQRNPVSGTQVSDKIMHLRVVKRNAFGEGESDLESRTRKRKDLEKSVPWAESRNAVHHWEDCPNGGPSSVVQRNRLDGASHTPLPRQIPA